MSNWVYRQSTGTLFLQGIPFAEGYSGKAEGKNNSDFQREHNIGPIPVGTWRILPFEAHHHALGPVVAPLVASKGTETWGRSGFFIHGDSIAHPGAASRGCIVLDRMTREFMRDCSALELTVVP